MPVDFDKLIDKYLHRESRPKTPGRYYPSEVGGCMRKVWFSYKKPKKTEPDLLKIFEVGNILHEFMTQVMKSEKTSEVELLDSEIPFKLDLGDFIVSGRVDGMFLVRENGKVVLLEVKTTKNVDWTKQPQESHKMQLQLYMHSLGVKSGILLYIQKDNLKSKSFPMEYDEKEAGDIISRFRKLHEHIKNDTVPEAEAKTREEMKWLCNYCDYADECSSA